MSLLIRDSIIDGTGRDNAIDSELNCEGAADLTIRRTTVLRNLQVQRITAGDDCIFTGDIRVREQQHGYLRNSYVPLNADDTVDPSHSKYPSQRTPRRFRCQPDLIVSENIRREASGQLALDRPHPQFLSVEYGQPNYCQLPTETDKAIAQGSESESEMGVFHNEYFPQRRSRLEQQLTDFTPANMQAAVLFADEL